MEPGEADGWRGGENCGEGRFYLEWEAGVVGLEVWEEVGEEWRGVRIGTRDVARSFRQRSWGSLMLNSCKISKSIFSNYGDRIYQ